MGTFVVGCGVASRGRRVLDVELAVSLTVKRCVPLYGTCVDLGGEDILPFT